MLSSSVISPWQILFWEDLHVVHFDGVDLHICTRLIIEDTHLTTMTLARCSSSDRAKDIIGVNPVTLSWWCSLSTVGYKIRSGWYSHCFSNFSAFHTVGQFSSEHVIPLAVTHILCLHVALVPGSTNYYFCLVLFPNNMVRCSYGKQTFRIRKGARFPNSTPFRPRPQTDYLLSHSHRCKSTITVCFSHS